MSAGKFVIFVRKEKCPSYGELSVFEYDNAARLKSQRRKQMLDRVLQSVTGWHDRYFHNAEFVVREILCDEGGSYGKRIGKVINLSNEMKKFVKQKKVELAKPQPKPKKKEKKPSLNSRQLRRAAKKACFDKEGSKDNWRAYL